ncbi:helix-turn-helix transcriptional regulator [Nonomuraea sp. NPDC052116]|uniref:helix-turn-helix domain-containing protein n=1 Tax=Nonomuraea sp. NPDC052116 TaxID=3155665 RepID=UPI0034305ED4
MVHGEHPLAEAREERGLGQKAVAAIMDVSVAPVSRIEHGEVGSLDSPRSL